MLSSRVGHYCMRERVYKYNTHAQIVFTLSIVTNRAELAQPIVFIKHKYMLMCSHKIGSYVMLCL